MTEHFPSRPLAWSGVAALGALTTLILSGVVLGRYPDAPADLVEAQAETAGPRDSSSCAERVQVRLFFGLVTPEGPVSETEWARFLADVITPRFPRGLTVVHADGQWQAPGRAGVTREPSQVVEIVDHGGPAMDRGIGEIVAIYRARFRQESVMLTRGRVEVCF